MEFHYALRTQSKYLQITAPDQAAVAALRAVPDGWTLDHDETLAQFLTTFSESDNDNLGSIKNFVEAIEVSSHTVK